MPGRKAKGRARIARISARCWEQYENHCKRENPILKGLKFRRIFERERVKTRPQTAEILGAPRQRAYQLTSLVTKSPQGIKGLVAANEDSAIHRYFTGRRLLALTRMADDADK